MVRGWRGVVVVVEGGAEAGPRGHVERRVFSEGFALGNDRVAGSWILFSSAMGAEQGMEGCVSGPCVH